MSDLKPLLKKPAGPSKKRWNNCSWGSDGPILCEVCGTSHPEDRDQNYIVSKFLGRQLVEDCCGALLDIVYGESGREFAEAFLEEFAENPTDSRFYTFRLALQEAMAKAAEKLAEVGKQVAEISAAAEKF